MRVMNDVELKENLVKEGMVIVLVVVHSLIVNIISRVK